MFQAQTYESPRYIPVADTAKLVRKALKESFPGVKFSVRSDSYSMGASIRISWTDGPCSKDVDSVVDQFKGANFNGMEDIKEHRKSTLNGERVRFGADYITTERHLTAPFLTRVAQAFVEAFSNYTMPRIEEQSTGAYYPDFRSDRKVEDMQQLSWTVNESELENLTVVIEGGIFCKAQKTSKQAPTPKPAQSEKTTTTALQNELFAIEQEVEQAQQIIEERTQPQPAKIINIAEKRHGKEIDDQVFDVLHQCTIKNGVLYLPNIRLDRKMYEAVNEVISRLGGKWNRKAKGHVFECDPSEDFQQVLETQAMPKKNPTAYYATPSNTAQDILYNSDFACIPTNTRRILEPSAGTGALAREIEAYCQSRGIRASIDCCEILPKHQQKLQEQGFFVVSGDFLSYNPVSKYQAIIMNPPFAIEGDSLAYITHIEHAWSLLADGGVLISIAPSGFTFREDKRTSAFRSLVEQHGTWRNMESGSFAESGTGVNTVVITMKKGA